jgi:NADPH2:quinone reductase
MAAIGLNFADIYRRKGNYHLAGNPPWICGYEGAGIIEAFGTGASSMPPFKVGDRVGFADSPFANAELCVVDLDKLVYVPDAVDLETAAALLLQGLTAQYLVRDSYRVKSADWAVVHAAGGGVGQLLVQLIKLHGAHVVALASTAEKRAAAMRLGADVALGYEHWVDAVRPVVPGGADVVYDAVGSTLRESLECARIGGTVVFYGMAGGDPSPVDPRLLMDRSLTLTGGDLWNVLTSAEERRRRAYELFELVAEGRLRVDIAARFSLDDGAAAHRFLESRAAIGKVLLIP